MFWVDLPGYGFAKVSQTKRGAWTKMIWNYVEKRENLQTLFVLIDSRHTPQSMDIAFVNKLGEKAIPFTIVFTKADKESQKEVAEHVHLFKEQLLKTWAELPTIFVTSAVKRLARKEMLEYIEQLRAAYVPAEKLKEQEEKESSSS